MLLHFNSIKNDVIRSIKIPDSIEITFLFRTITKPVKIYYTAMQIIIEIDKIFSFCIRRSKVKKLQQLKH